MITLLTGVAGFIGYHVAQALLDRGDEVIGLDNLNDYYDIGLKKARLDQLLARPGFTFVQIDIADHQGIQRVAASAPGISQIIHLAAQAGVRYSMDHPFPYISSNVLGHLSLLEVARHLPNLRHMVYASSSSVYGLNKSLPFHETTPIDKPASLYAATKIADEAMSHAYGHLYQIPLTGLRFFTVYGPWGRPDMAYFKFAHAITQGHPITLYKGNKLRRDFTFIDDVVAGLLGCLDHPPAVGEAPRCFNIGNHRSEPVAQLVRLLEEGLRCRARIEYSPRPLADIEETCADIDALHALTGYKPRVCLKEGIAAFTDWFKAYYKLPTN